MHPLTTYDSRRARAEDLLAASLRAARAERSARERADLDRGDDEPGEMLADAPGAELFERAV